MHDILWVILKNKKSPPEKNGALLNKWSLPGRLFEAARSQILSFCFKSSENVRGMHACLLTSLRWSCFLLCPEQDLASPAWDCVAGNRGLRDLVVTQAPRTPGTSGPLDICALSEHRIVPTYIVGCSSVLWQLNGKFDTVPMAEDVL